MNMQRILPETRMTDEAHKSGILQEKRIRTVALCLFRHGDRIFVFEGYDPIKEETFYRPLGGSIEFGERGSDAVARELMEEAGLEVTNLRYLGTCESIFTYLGEMGHEIVLVYTGDFTDPSVYDRDWFECKEDDDTPFRAVWKRLDEFGKDKDGPLYPDGLMEKLMGQAGWE